MKRPAVSSKIEAPLNPKRNNDPKALVNWEDLRHWQKDNEFILSGYRQASYSLRQSLASIRGIHNETVNIWSHGLGSLAFSLIPISGYLAVGAGFESGTRWDVLALAIYFLSVTICFTFSTSFHVLLNHSPKLWRVFSQLDHLGIVLVIWGSTIPSTYFGFYCHNSLQILYYCFATSAALSCAFATTLSTFQTPKGRTVRASLYGFLGLSAFIPAVHGVLINGWNLQNTRMGLNYFLGLGILNATGTVIYAARVPERWYPRRFDIWGSSHQIMHVLVMCGAVSHSIGLVQAFQYWNGMRHAGGISCT